MNSVEEAGRIVLQPDTREYIRSFRGTFRTRPGHKPATQQLLEDRAGGGRPRQAWARRACNYSWGFVDFSLDKVAPMQYTCARSGNETGRRRDQAAPASTGSVSPERDENAGLAAADAESAEES